jgi:hypothetical protein
MQCPLWSRLGARRAGRRRPIHEQPSVMPGRAGIHRTMIEITRNGLTTHRAVPCCQPRHDDIQRLTTDVDAPDNGGQPSPRGAGDSHGPSPAPPTHTPTTGAIGECGLNRMPPVARRPCELLAQVVRDRDHPDAEGGEIS